MTGQTSNARQILLPQNVLPWPFPSALVSGVSITFWWEASILMVVQPGQLCFKLNTYCTYTNCDVEQACINFRAALKNIVLLHMIYFLCIHVILPNYWKELISKCFAFKYAHNRLSWVWPFRTCAYVSNPKQEGKILLKKYIIWNIQTGMKYRFYII